MAALTCVSMLLAGAALVAQQNSRQAGGVGLTIFEDDNYGGRTATLRSATPDLRSTGLDGKTSSLRIAAGEMWEVCSGRNYSGRCVVFSGFEASLRSSGWNDTISSARPVRNGGSGRNQGPLPPFGQRGLELFAGQDYSGQRLVVSEAVADLKRLNFADRASSLRVGRGEEWEICVNANFDDCRVIDDDVPNLGTMGLGRIVSSVRPRFNGGRGGRGGQGGGGIPQPGRDRIAVYAEPGFRGRAIDISGSITPFPLNNSGSIRVYGGRWEICDRADFRGQCRTITSSVSDLGELGMRDRLSSVRPR
jgi:hypothetical protein